MVPLQKVKEIVDKYESLEKELSSGSIDSKLFAKKSKEYSRLKSIISIAKRYLNFESEIYLGIRPEDISLENISEIAVKIKIDLIENLGSEKIIYTHINIFFIILYSCN